MTENNNLFYTQSLYEGAFLLSQGFAIAGKKRTGKKMTLYFYNATEAERQVLRFYNGATVIAKVFCDSYRTIKDYVFEER